MEYAMNLLIHGMRNVAGCCWLLRAARAPVDEELDEDDEDAGEHGEAEQDEAPAEHGEAVRLGLGQRGLLAPGLRHRHPPVAATAMFILEPIWAL